MNAALFRAPVAISSELESVPPPPEGPKIFGLCEAITTVEREFGHE